MINLALELPNGKYKVFKTSDIDRAFTRSESILRNLNFEDGYLYRVDEFGNGKRFVSTIINDDYQPDQSDNYQETFTTYTELEPKTPNKKRSKKDPRKPRTAANQSNNNIDNSNYEVTIQAVAERLETTPTALRRKLRSSDVEKPGKRWAWQSWEDPTVQKILSWA